MATIFEYTKFETNKDLQDYRDFLQLYEIYDFKDNLVYTVHTGKQKISVMITEKDGDIIKPFKAANALRSIYQFDDNRQLIQYLISNPHNNIEIEVIHNYPYKGIKGKTETVYYNSPEDVQRHLYFFIVQDDDIVASVITDEFEIDKNNGLTFLHIDRVDSYVQRKGYCVTLCQHIMDLCRQVNIKYIKLESAGGIAAHRCYIHAFLLYKNGYNHVDIESQTKNKGFAFTLNKVTAIDWLKNSCNNAIICDDDYSMYFHD